MLVQGVFVRVTVCLMGRLCTCSGTVGGSVREARGSSKHVGARVAHGLAASAFQQGARRAPPALARAR